MSSEMTFYRFDILFTARKNAQSIIRHPRIKFDYLNIHVQFNKKLLYYGKNVVATVYTGCIKKNDRIQNCF